MQQEQGAQGEDKASSASTSLLVESTLKRQCIHPLLNRIDYFNS